MVVAVWLFLVFILTSSYTASLSAMLTVRQLQPNVTDIEWLKTNNLRVGCDGDSFVRNYLENVLNFKPENIVNVSSVDGYPKEFESNNISAAFLELPHEKVFLNKYCKRFTGTIRAARFSGFGFVSCFCFCLFLFHLYIIVRVFTLSKSSFAPPFSLSRKARHLPGTFLKPC
jgi:ionotropic glutamate receptor